MVTGGRDGDLPRRFLGHRHEPQRHLEASDKYVWLGQAGDVPVVGDFNGDGTSEMGILPRRFWPST